MDPICRLATAGYEASWTTVTTRAAWSSQASVSGVIVTAQAPTSTTHDGWAHRRRGMG
jgi:hypothetical protein